MRVGRGRAASAVALGILALTNVAGYRARSRAASTAINAAATVALLGVARWAHLGAAAVGLDRAQLGRGLRTGAGWSGLALAVPAVLLAFPATRHVFDDERNAHGSALHLGRTIALHIPVGTVLFEEVAFRAVLPALLEQGCEPSGERHDTDARGSLGAADLVSAALFGCWHYLSAHDLKRANPSVARLAERARTLDPVVLVMVATGLVGVGFARARRDGGHLVAPALIHLSINVTGAVIPWVRSRLGSGPAARSVGSNPARPRVRWGDGGGGTALRG